MSDNAFGAIVIGRIFAFFTLWTLFEAWQDRGAAKCQAHERPNRASDTNEISTTSRSRLAPVRYDTPARRHVTRTPRPMSN